MDIGKKNNYKFYDGYDDESEIIIRFGDEFNIHIWEGYFDDIFENPPLDGKGWTGFTKDYHQFEGIFSGKVDKKNIEAKKYLQDLYYYRGKTFKFEETSELLEMLIKLFEIAVSKKFKVTIEIH